MTEQIEAVAEPVEAPLEVVEAPEVDRSEDEKMADVYDKAMDERPRDENGRFAAKEAEPEAEAPEVEEDAVKADTEEGVEEKADVPEESDAPSYLPQEVREAWKDIPEAARDSFAKSQQEMSAKLADMGRRAQGFEPVANAVIKAARDFPELAGQTPQQIAENVFELAHTQANLKRDPVGTIMKVAHEMGFMDQLSARFSGHAQNPDLNNINMQQELAALRQELQQSQNPANITQVVSQEIAERDINREVNEFAESKEHWTAVETALPQFITAAHQIKGYGASNTDILNAAYDMAINAYGLKATPTVSEKTPVVPSPKRAEAVIKAKSANVTSNASKASPVSEKEAMGSAYDRMMSE